MPFRFESERERVRERVVLPYGVAVKAQMGWRCDSAGWYAVPA